MLMTFHTESLVYMSNGQAWHSEARSGSEPMLGLGFFVRLELGFLFRFRDRFSLRVRVRV